MDFKHEIIQFNDDIPIKLYNGNSLLEDNIPKHTTMISKHWHSNIEIFYVFTGRVDLWVNSEKYELCNDNLILININEIHSAQNIENGNGVLLQIPHEFVKNYYPHIDNISFVCNSVLETNNVDKYCKLKNMLKEIDYIYNEGKDGYVLKSYSLLFDMLFELVTNFSISKPDKENIKSKKNLERLTKIVEYIKENKKADLSLDMLAQKVNLTPQYLSKYFQKYMGVSYIKYLNSLRFESAYKELVNTDLSITDGTDPTFPTGGTDIPFISSAYYCYSSRIVAKAAKALGKEEIAKEYEDLSNAIREAIRDEYFSKNGRITINTQTALIVALFMELAPEDKIERVANDLREKLKKDKNHLKTGFVGTPYFCKVLSENGCNDLAYTLLLNKDYPSWLYAVTMGATTIWERWNSVLPDGKISGTDMNSLNHYAYGSIAEWMYRYVAGINPVEDKPGFRHIKLTPMPDYRLKYAKATYNSTVGVYESQWEITEEGNLSFKFVIPFNASATLVLPDAKLENVKVNGKTLKDTELKSNQSNKNVAVELTSGSYEFDYLPEVAYIKYYGIDVNLDELVANEEVKNIVGEKLPMIIAEDMLERSGHQSLRELSFMPFSPITNDLLEELDKKLGEIKVSVI